MKGPPRDHHYIPVFYLKQWACEADGKLIEYSVNHGKFIDKSVGPRGTGFETDLYSFPELPADAAQYLESVVLQNSDNEASLALVRHLAVKTEPWSAEQRTAWSRFVMGLHLRHPDVMREFRAAAKSLWDKGREGTQRGDEQIREEGDPATFEEYMEKVDPTIEVKARLNMIIRALDNAVIGNHLNKMKWAVADVTGSPQILLTSDRPVTIYRLRDPDGSLFLPISPTKLFIAANQQKTIDALGKGTPQSIVAKANEILVQRARRYVYSRDKWQKDYEEHLNKKGSDAPLSEFRPRPRN